MTLVLCGIAAAVCSIIWYINEKARGMMVGTLSLMYWGAFLMWLVDAIVEYIHEGASAFEIGIAEFLNGTYLGLSVILLGLIIWLVIFLIKDPNNVIRKKS